MNFLYTKVVILSFTSFTTQFWDWKLEVATHFYVHKSYVELTLSEPTWRTNLCPCGTRSCYGKDVSSIPSTTCSRIRHNWYIQGTGRSTTSSWVWLRHWPHTASSTISHTPCRDIALKALKNSCCFRISAYWSKWVMKTLVMPLFTYLCTIYYLYDAKNAFSAVHSLW